MPISRSFSLCLILSTLLAGAACSSGSLSGSRRPSAIALPTERQFVAASFQPQNVSRIKVAFFDADSTLRVSRSGSVSANHATDVVVLPCIGPKLLELARNNYLIAIVSNQGGIKAKAVTEADADAALRYTIDLLVEQGGIVHEYDYAEGDDEYRKPNPGMGDRLERTLKRQFGPTAAIDKDASFMVGDSAYKKKSDKYEGDLDPHGKPGQHFSNADRLFAKNYGVRFYEPADYFGWRERGVDIFENKEALATFLKNNPQPCN